MCIKSQYWHLLCDKGYLLLIILTNGLAVVSSFKALSQLFN